MIRTLQRRNLCWLSLSTLIIVLDQLSKWQLQKVLQPYVPIKLLPFLNLTLAFNRGTAFSLFSSSPSWSQWGLSLLAIAIAIYMIYLMLQTPSTHRWTLTSYALIIGGALGNLLDRLWQGYVTDFIDFHLGSWHFATFNIADSAITIGAIVLAIILLRNPVTPADSSLISHTETEKKK